MGSWNSPFREKYEELRIESPQKRGKEQIIFQCQIVKWEVGDINFM